MIDKSILTECYADTILLEVLVPTRSGYNKQNGCNAVAKAVKSHDGFRLGISDKDKKVVKYLEEFEEIDRIEGSLILLRHKNAEVHHYFILIIPALETWVINICKEEDISLKDYGIGNTLKDLKRITKSAISKNDVNLNNLFKSIKSKEGNKSINKLKGWVTLLKEKQYTVSTDDLKKS